MDEKSNVSRRNFLKDLGGSTIGAAIISSQFLDPGRVEAAAAGAKVSVAAREPSKQLKEKWQIIRAVMRNVLKDFQGLGAMQVNLRLNASNKEDRLPVFIDWLGADSVVNKLVAQSGIPGAEKDWGLYRLGDGLFSTVYLDAVDKVLKGIVEREWTPETLKKEKKTESQLLIQKASLNYQKFIGIVAGSKRRCVGTLTVSFEKKPNVEKLPEIDDKMKQWASWPPKPKSELVQKIESNFVLGGPFL